MEVSEALVLGPVTAAQIERAGILNGVLWL